MRCWRQILSTLLPVTLPFFVTNCVLPPPPQPNGGAHVVMSNGGSIVTVTSTLIALPGTTLKIGFFHDPQNADCGMEGN